MYHACSRRFLERDARRRRCMKKLKFKGILLNFDGYPDKGGDCFSSDCKIEFENPVVVTHEFNNKTPEGFLGYGKLAKAKKSLKYEIEIDVERLPKKLYKCLTPAVGGHIVERKGNVFTKCVVNKIGLSIGGNADPRIKKLKPLKNS